MKVYEKDNGLWQELKRAALAGLLCLPFYSAIAESVTPVTGGNMETVNSVPEGYRPLPVTEFVVDVEKNDTYTVIVGVEFPGKPSDAQEWLEKNFTGRIDIYKKNSLEPIYSHFVFNKKNSHPNAGASGIISGKTFWGEQFSVKLEKDDYIISPKLYVVDDGFKYTCILFFKRVRPIWW